MSIISVAQVKGATMMTKQRLIQLIHIARNELGMDEDTYR
ncbi:TPA: regulatory protein GemA, partial [Escherichia coli]